MTATETPTPTIKTHPLDHLFHALQAVVDRIPWHSETQHDEVLGYLRDGEEALKGDSLAESPAVIRPATPNPATDVAMVAAGAGVAQFDYDKLAAAMVAQAQQQAQAEAAVAANPGWVPPGSVTAPPTDVHAAAADS